MQVLKFLNLNGYTAILNSNAVTKIVNLNGDTEILNLKRLKYTQILKLKKIII